MIFGLWVEDKLDGQSNFGARKERIISVLEEAEVWDIVDKTLVPPIDATSWLHTRKTVSNPKD